MACELNVLMVGSGENYHLEPLARCLKAAAPTLRLGCAGLWQSGSERERIPVTTSPDFDYLLPDSSLPRQFPPRLRQALPTNVREASASRSLAPYRPVANALRDFRDALRLQRRMMVAGRRFCALSETPDLIHLQSLFLSDAHYWLLSQTKIPFIISCWGSDVLRTSERRAVRLHAELLERCAAITLTGPEFQEVLLAKFGRHLVSKIHHTYFNPKVEAILDEPASQSLGSAPTDGNGLISICLGHNGFSEGNHIEMLSSLARLKEDIKKRLFLRIPMTYGAPDGYIDQVRKASVACGCAHEILTDYMAESQVAEFRKSTSVLVFAPVSDAFSATVSQALAAGSVVVMGAWLPNRLRREAGFFFHELNHLENLGSLIAQIVTTWPSDWAQSLGNRSRAREVFSEIQIGRGWLDVYRSVVEVHS